MRSLSAFIKSPLWIFSSMAAGAPRSINAASQVRQLAADSGKSLKGNGTNLAANVTNEAICSRSASRLPPKRYSRRLGSSLKMANTSCNRAVSTSVQAASWNAAHINSISRARTHSLRGAGVVVSAVFGHADFLENKISRLAGLAVRRFNIGQGSRPLDCSNRLTVNNSVDARREFAID